MRNSCHALAVIGGCMTWKDTSQRCQRTCHYPFVGRQLLSLQQRFADNYTWYPLTQNKTVNFSTAMHPLQCRGTQIVHGTKIEKILLDACKIMMQILQGINVFQCQIELHNRTLALLKIASSHRPFRPGYIAM